MASTGGVTRATCLHRDLSVIAMSSGSTDGAQSRNTVDGGGSSTTLSSAFAAPSVSRSASSITTTCHRPVPGRREAICTMLRISSTPMDRPSGMIRRTSAWVPAIVVVQARHSPHPGTPSLVHCSAAAKQSAAIDRPDPGGPVTSHACVMGPVRRRWNTVSRITACGLRGGHQLGFHGVLTHQTRKDTGHRRSQ